MCKLLKQLQFPRRSLPSTNVSECECAQLVSEFSQPRAESVYSLHAVYVVVSAALMLATALVSCLL